MLPHTILPQPLNSPRFFWYASWCILRDTTPRQPLPGHKHLPRHIITAKKNHATPQLLLTALRLRDASPSTQHHDARFTPRRHVHGKQQHPLKPPSSWHISLSTHLSHSVCAYKFQTPDPPATLNQATKFIFSHPILIHTKYVLLKQNQMHLCNDQSLQKLIPTRIANNFPGSVDLDRLIRLISNVGFLCLSTVCTFWNKKRTINRSAL